MGSLSPLLAKCKEVFPLWAFVRIDLGLQQSVSPPAVPCLLQHGQGSQLPTSVPGCQEPEGFWRRCDWHPAQRCRGEIRAKAHMVEFPSALWLGCSHLHKPGSSFSNYEKNFYLNPKPCCHLAMATLAAIREGKSSVTPMTLLIPASVGRRIEPEGKNIRLNLLTTACFQLVC